MLSVTLTVVRTFRPAGLPLCRRMLALVGWVGVLLAQIDYRCICCAYRRHCLIDAHSKATLSQIEQQIFLDDRCTL
ncbi:hypothetical protein EI94DRAFT_1722020 [Lactarius quietus]|nr:hypothetical protein EI94DRAFT_1722020 [Lactarius quietus]